MASVTRMVVAVAVIMGGVMVSGAPMAVGAHASDTRITTRMTVIAGDNATCPWKVYVSGDDSGHEFCTRELSISFAGSTNIAERSTAASYSNFTTDVPLFAATQPIPTAASEASSKFRPGSTEEEEEQPAAMAAAVPEGYVRVGAGGVYKLHVEGRPWHAARAACEAEGAHLLVLDSVAEARALRRFLASTNYGDWTSFTLHAGFRLDLVTTDGKSSRYENWSRKGPDSEFCGQIDNDIWMQFGRCSHRNPFICEYEPRPRTIAVSEAALKVPLPTAECSEVKKNFLRNRGYVPLFGWNRTYIKAFATTTSWSTAREVCEEDDAQLVTIESEEKAEALYAFIESSGTENFFLGVKTGDPVTVLGEPLQDKVYQRWTSRNHQETCFFAGKKLLYHDCKCTEDTRVNYISYDGSFLIICQVIVE